MANYIIIPKDWANEMDGFLSPPNVFMSYTTKEGDRVVSCNACRDFPEQFEQLKETGWLPQVVALSLNDLSLDDMHE